MMPPRHQHQTEQVRIHVGVAEQLSGRPESAQLQLARIEFAARRQSVGLDASGEGGCVQPGIGASVDEATDVERAEQLVQITGVVRLIVGDHDRGEAINPELAEAVLHPVLGGTGVHQDWFRTGRLKQD